MEPLYCGHHWDRPKCQYVSSSKVRYAKTSLVLQKNCPDYKDVLIQSVQIREVSLFQSDLIREVPLNWFNQSHCPLLRWILL